jgi:hypothetical protein
MNKIEQRMAELMEPVDQQLLMCDDREDQLMMACAMLQRVREVFDYQIGVDGRRQMFKEYVE